MGDVCAKPEQNGPFGQVLHPYTEQRERNQNTKDKRGKTVSSLMRICWNGVDALGACVEGIVKGKEQVRQKADSMKETESSACGCRHKCQHSSRKQLVTFCTRTANGKVNHKCTLSQPYGSQSLLASSKGKGMTCKLL